MNEKYIYCKSGFNVIRIPSSDYNSKEINPENVEVLMWKDGEKRVFERNDLSELICNEDNIFALQCSKVLDDLIDKDIKNLVRKYKDEQKPYSTPFFATPRNVRSVNHLRFCAAKSQTASIRKLKRKSRKKNTKAYSEDLIYKQL